MGAMTRATIQDGDRYSVPGLYDLLLERSAAARAGACTPRELREMAVEDVPGLIREVRRLRARLMAEGVLP